MYYCTYQFLATNGGGANVESGVRGMILASVAPTEALEGVKEYFG
jgi:hypothetical protein